MTAPLRDPILYPGEPLPEKIPGRWICVGDHWTWQDDRWEVQA